MFVGHYFAALLGKSLCPEIHIAYFFVAAQFLDYLHFSLALAGVEIAVVRPSFLPASHLELIYMPYTHSLVAAVFWSLIGYQIARFLWPRQRRAPGVVAGVIFSHWLTDLLTHTPDLPVFSGDGMKLGLGLWRSVAGTIAAEVGLLIWSLWRYRKVHVHKASVPRMTVAVGILIAAGLIQTLGPPTSTNHAVLSVLALISYTLAAVLASWADEPSKVKTLIA